MDPNNCSGPLSKVSETEYKIDGPLFLYYGLTNFYQNHRRYLTSRSYSQLQGNVIIDKEVLAECEPALTSNDGVLILSPCGLAAQSVFNDTFSAYKGLTGTETYP